MRSLILSLLTFGAAALMMRSLNGQSVDPSASSPYGGPPITFGELAASSSGGSLPPNTPSICPTGTNPNCVVTGQYSRGRLGQNALEQTLAGYNTTTNPLPNTFTWINYYATNSSDYYYIVATGKGAKSNPTMAQPLWLNNVPIGGTNHNVLLTATLTGSVYAYDADSGAILWDRYSGSSAGPPLVQNCGGTTGTPVLPSFQSIPYYGILSTPVVEGETTDPVMFVVSGCQNAVGVVSYYLNAIDITTGSDLMTGTGLGQAGGLPLSGPAAFRAGNQFQRPALLLNHTKNSMGQTTGTYLYIGFGTGITELGSGTKGYNGWIFGYSISYTGTTPTSVSATALTKSPFSTTPSEATSGVYPPTSAAAPGWVGSPAANPSCNTSSNCFNGDNWVDGTNVTGHAGGVWMSGRGPSSDASADVYFGAGNGTFGCTTSGTTCTSVSTVNNFGESAVELAAPLASSPSISVADFYAPYTNNVANDQPANGSPFSAASTQVQALNRYDLDFGDPGVISFVTQVSSRTQTWLTTADKTGYVYVMPTLSSGSGSSGMGQFRTGDSGLTSGSYTTQAPFQMSRLPASTGSSTVCPAPVASTSPEFTSANCDQIMGFAVWSNSSTLSTYLLYAWPWNEPVIGRQGSASAGPPVNFAFNTTIEPCPGWPGTACPSGFPIGNQAYGGGKLAIAANGSSNATLWGSKYSTAFGDTGQLWAWVINPTSGALTPLFSPTISSNNAGNCTGLPTLPSSYVPASFAEPTLVNGKVYVPAFESFSSGTTILTGGGVLVFGTCQ